MQHHSTPASPITTDDGCPICGVLLKCYPRDPTGPDHRFCGCGYERPAPPKNAATLIWIGGGVISSIIEPVNRITAGLTIRLVLSNYMGADTSRRWAFMRRVNWATRDGLGITIIDHGTHILVFGRRDSEGYVKYARDHGKPVRVIDDRRK
jgi:hypothetical protein